MSTSIKARIEKQTHSIMKLPGSIYDIRSNQVFISYAHEDKLYAEKLYNGLREQGLNLWWDQAFLESKNLDHMLDDIIQIEIQKSRFLILFLSKNFWKKIDSDEVSGFVKHEFKLARNKKRKIPTFKIISLNLDDGDYEIDNMDIDLCANINEGIDNCVIHIYEYICGVARLPLTETNEKDNLCYELLWKSSTKAENLNDAERLVSVRKKTQDFFRFRVFINIFHSK